ncbi:DNL-type zinc finger protein [Nymphaea thermarum]|nr:DNL-type zinc finger protein [Nymphaea thermarum]
MQNRNLLTPFTADDDFQGFRPLDQEGKLQRPILLQSRWVRAVSSSERSESEVSTSNPGEDASMSYSYKADSSIENLKGNSSVHYKALSNLKASARHDMVMMYTCKVCETRSARTACRESYEKGIVVVRCSGCNNLHLIADRLGWFGEPGSVEDFLAARGELVKKGSLETMNLTVEDLAGAKST